MWLTKISICMTLYTLSIHYYSLVPTCLATTGPNIITSSTANKSQLLGYNDSQKRQPADAQVDDIIKDTIQLLDVFDKKLIQLNNQTPNALMRDNIRLLELDLNQNARSERRSNDADEELLRIAETFSSERQKQAVSSGGPMNDIMTPQASNQNENFERSTSTLEESQTLLGSNRRMRQLDSNSSHFDNDFTDRHIKFSLDLMQALFVHSQDFNGKHANGNQLESFLISPVSIQMVLMMMHLGSRGQTKRELAHCLHLPASFEQQAPVIEQPSYSVASQLANAVQQQGNKLRRRNPTQQSTVSKKAASAMQQQQPQQTNNNMHELFGAAMRNLLKDPSVVKALTSANQIFVQRELSLLPQYEQAVRHYYGAEMKLVDFQQEKASPSMNSTNNSTITNQQSSEQSVQQTINEWVERQTRGKISNLLTSPISSSTLMMAINVLYFKGDWQYKFDPVDTDPDAWFTLANGQTVKMPMMVNRLPLAHAYDPIMKTSVIELPYKAQRLGLFVLLPDEANGIYQTMRQLNSTTFANLISMMRKSAPTSGTSSATDNSALSNSAGINVRIPKFAIESSPRLSQILSQQLGLKTLFAADVADLSGMFGRPSVASRSNGTSNVPNQVGLDELLHKAVLQVHEQGSIAAAASATIVERVGLFNGQYFEADHPFLIFLMDKQTGLVLFSGLFAGPSSGAANGEQTS